MLENVAKIGFRYFQEAKMYVWFTLALFGISAGYLHFVGGWGDGNFIGALVLFLGVFGKPILLGFCACMLYLSFEYAFHPGLNGKESGNRKRVVLARSSSALTCIFIGLLVFAILSGRHFI